MFRITKGQISVPRRWNNSIDCDSVCRVDGVPIFSGTTPCDGTDGTIFHLDDRWRALSGAEVRDDHSFRCFGCSIPRGRICRTDSDRQLTSFAVMSRAFSWGLLPRPGTPSFVNTKQKRRKYQKIKVVATEFELLKGFLQLNPRLQFSWK